MFLLLTLTYFTSFSGVFVVDFEQSLSYVVISNLSNTGCSVLYFSIFYINIRETTPDLLGTANTMVYDG